MDILLIFEQKLFCMQTTLFTFKRPGGTWFCLFFATFLLLCSLYSLYIIIANNPFRPKHFIAFILPAVWMFLSTISFMRCFLQQKYAGVDRGKQLLLDKQNRLLQLTCNNKTYTINNTDVENVEVHETPRVFNKHFGELSYLKINLVSGSYFFVTWFLATEYDLLPFLKGKKRILAPRRFMNKIVVDDLRQCIC